MNNRTNPEEGALDEPALTQKNSATVLGEEQITDSGESSAERDASERTQVRVMPSSYGAAGDTADATEEGGDGTGI
jgi:hypothetical protein